MTPMHIVNGQGGACPPKQNGNVPPAAMTNVITHGGMSCPMNTIPIQLISWAIPLGLAHTQREQAHLGYWIWPAMYGSGWQIVISRTIIKYPWLKIPLGPHKKPCLIICGYCAVVLIKMMELFYVLQIAVFLRDPILWHSQPKKPIMDAVR